MQTVERLSLGGLALAADAVTAEVVSAMHAQGLRPLLIKGPTVTKWLYESRIDRPYGDTDLLAAPSEIRAVERILRLLGFREGPSSAFSAPLSPGREWIRDRDGAIVDVHQTIYGASVAGATVWEVLSERTEDMWLKDVRIEMPSEAGRALLLGLHAFHHGPQGHVVRDVDRAAKILRFEVWEEAAQLAARLDATDAFAEGLRLSRAGALVADQLGLGGGTARSALLSQPAPTTDLGYALYLDEMASMPVRERIRFMLSRLVPSSRDLRWWRDAERFKGPLVAAYFVRLWRMGRRTAGGFKILVRARRRSSGDRRREAA